MGRAAKRRREQRGAGTQYRKWRADRKVRENREVTWPNRRGDYREAGPPSWWWKHYGEHRRLALPREAIRHSFSKARRIKAAAQGLGTRTRKRIAKGYWGLKPLGYQLPKETEKPKIPGRVLRDAQEGRLWEERLEEVEQLREDQEWIDDGWNDER